MGFVKITERPHYCTLPKPNTKKYWFGTIWECDECHRQYELQDDQRDGPFWMPIQPQAS